MRPHGLGRHSGRNDRARRSMRHTPRANGAANNDFTGHQPHGALASHATWNSWRIRRFRCSGRKGNSAEAGWLGWTRIRANREGAGKTPAREALLIFLSLPLYFVPPGDALGNVALKTERARLVKHRAAQLLG